jgi:sulfonate transport system permease protein
MKSSRLLPWVVPIALLATWELSSRAGWLPARILPSPSAVAEAAGELLKRGELQQSLLVSAGRALAGLAIGGGLGLILGFANGLSRAAETVLDTSLQMARNLPLLALIPLVITWFGVGEAAKIFLVSLGVFFPVYMNTFHAIRHIDPALVEMARVYRFGFWKFLREVIIPGALPGILLGVRYGLGLMWITLVVAETISATSGIGQMAMNAREFLRTDIVVLTVLLYAALGKGADVVTRLIERWLIPWKRTEAVLA